MRDTGTLRQICADFRFSSRRLDTTDVSEIETEVQEYRDTFFTRPAPQLPPEPLRELLPVMGWLIYETSLRALRDVKASFELMTEPDAAASRRAHGLVRRLADSARRLVWPEFAPRALGAIRAQALTESKRDTEAGYDAAYIVHREAAERYESYRETHGDHPGRDRYLLDLDEIFLQLALSEVGTACRTTERVLCRWIEDFAAHADEERWVQRLYRDLSEGLEVGGHALDKVREISETHQLVHTITEHRLALVTAYRNPGIMTARASLLALTLSAAMEHLGRPPSHASTWPAERSDLLDLFGTAYRAIEEPVHDAGGAGVPMILDHRRALVQLRLHLALLVPGVALPSTMPFAAGPARNPLDEVAVQELSRWLTTERSDGGAQHGNSIGALTMPLAIRSVLTLRARTGDAAGYPRWRREWPHLGRFSSDPGRVRRADMVLSDAVGAPLLNVGPK